MIKVGDIVYLASEGLWINHKKLVVQKEVTKINDSGRFIWVNGGLWMYPETVFLKYEDALHSAQSMLVRRRSGMLSQIENLQQIIKEEKEILNGPIKT